MIQLEYTLLFGASGSATPSLPAFGPSPARAWVGIGPPNYLYAPIKDRSGSFNLTTVLAVNLNVVRKDGTQVVWSTTIVSQTTSVLWVAHAYAAGDCTVEGSYDITPELVFASGTTKCFTRKLKVCSPQSIT